MHTVHCSRLPLAVPYFLRILFYQTFDTLFSYIALCALRSTVSDEQPRSGTGTEPSRAGLTSSQSALRYLPEHGVRPAAACLVHPFGVAAPVAALQQRMGFVTHVGGEHLSWPNAGTLRSQRVEGAARPAMRHASKPTILTTYSYSSSSSYSPPTPTTTSACSWPTWAKLRASVGRPA